MLGLTVTRIFQNGPENSTVELSDGSLSVEALWRVINDGRVALTKRDHNQKFGLPEPVNAYADASELLVGKQIVKVEFREESGDLLIHFEGGRRLDVVNDSSGYEPWQLYGPGIHLVAVGTGSIYDFSKKT